MAMNPKTNQGQYLVTVCAMNSKQIIIEKYFVQTKSSVETQCVAQMEAKHPHEVGGVLWGLLTLSKTSPVFHDSFECCS